MGKNQINVALFGLGRIGQMHAENLANHKSFYLKYTYDISKELAKNFLKNLIQRILTILKKLLETKI